MLNVDEYEAVKLTLLISAAAVAVGLPIAVATAIWLERCQFFGKSLIETAINFPLVLPPIVTGYLLLVTFGRNGWFGSILDRTLGLRVIFDWKGAAIAAAVVSFPLMVRPIRQAIQAVDVGLVHAARTLGATRWNAFWTITLPLAMPGILSGAVLGFARSMGEFGATIMIAGNIPGRTRTISLLIYSTLESPGGHEHIGRLVLFSIAIAAGALWAGNYLEHRGKRRMAEARNIH